RSGATPQRPKPTRDAERSPKGVRRNSDGRARPERRSVSNDTRLARNLDRNAGREKLMTDAQRARLSVPIVPPFAAPMIQSAPGSRLPATGKEVAELPKALRATARSHLHDPQVVVGVRRHESLPERPVAGAEHPHAQKRIGGRMRDDRIRERAATARHEPVDDPREGRGDDALV